MKSLFNFLFVVFLLLTNSCKEKTKKRTNYEDELLFRGLAFENKSDLQYFKVETQVDDSEVQIKNGYLDIDALKGATVWLKKKITAPVKIEYTAVVVDENAPNDRVSDLNCFFMAIDPLCPSDITTCPDSLRTGRFPDYHRLRTYYVGYGGHDNTTTRMRRYVGYTKERPVLDKHDLGYPEIIVPNEKIEVKIKVSGNNITYYHNNRLIFQMNDTLPYHEGWFAFRTVRNHLRIQDLKITQLKP